jgi:DNA-binding GntR family transcriptional regulator
MATGIFRPTVTSNAATGVADQLRAAILSGALAGGTKIREVEVAEQTGVSRGPVREALRMLSDEGLVVLRHNRGAVVAGITPDDAVEIYAVRGALAVIAFKAIVAAGLHEQTETSIAQKLADIREQQLEALRGMEPGDSMAFLRAEFDFQNALVSVAGLERVTARFTQLTTELCMLIAALAIEYPDVNAAYVKYDLLLQALQDGDFDAAELHWRNHITEASFEVDEGMPGGPEALSERPWMLSVI